MAGNGDDNDNDNDNDDCDDDSDSFDSRLLISYNRTKNVSTLESWLSKIP